jgi:hypothetical protein
VVRDKNAERNAAFLLEDEASQKRVFSSARIEYESTAVGAALRNRTMVGGERFRKADFYVASVETPKILIDGAPKLFKTLEKAMRAAHATGAVPHEAPRQMVGMIHSTPDERRGFPPLPFWAQSKYLTEWHAEPRGQMIAMRIAALMHHTVCTVLTEVFEKSQDFIRKNVGLCYLNTLRANFSVAMRTEGGMLLFNVRALEQQLKFGGGESGIAEWWGADIDGAGYYPALTERFRATPRVHRRYWRYWYSRVSMVLERSAATVNDLKFGSVFASKNGREAEQATFATPQRATWIYDPAARAKFEQLCDRVGAVRDPPTESRLG